MAVSFAEQSLPNGFVDAPELGGIIYFNYGEPSDDVSQLPVASISGGKSRRPRLVAVRGTNHAHPLNRNGNPTVACGLA